MKLLWVIPLAIAVATAANIAFGLADIDEHAELTPRDRRGNSPAAAVLRGETRPVARAPETGARRDVSMRVSGPPRPGVSPSGRSAGPRFPGPRGSSWHTSPSTCSISTHS